MVLLCFLLILHFKQEQFWQGCSSVQQTLKHFGVELFRDSDLGLFTLQAGHHELYKKGENNCKAEPKTSTKNPGILY